MGAFFLWSLSDLAADEIWIGSFTIFNLNWYILKLGVLENKMEQNAWAGSDWEQSWFLASFFDWSAETWQLTKWAIVGKLPPVWSNSSRQVFANCHYLVQRLQDFHCHCLHCDMKRELLRKETSILTEPFLKEENILSVFFSLKCVYLIGYFWIYGWGI